MSEGTVRIERGDPESEGRCPCKSDDPTVWTISVLSDATPGNEEGSYLRFCPGCLKKLATLCCALNVTERWDL